MLRFTPSGVVSSPEVLHVRLGPRPGARLRAGAPEPTRALTEAELRANVAHFTAGRRGPRTSPCTALVLSGWSAERHEALVDVVGYARGLGIRHVTVHADGPAPVEGAPVDAVTCAVTSVGQVEALASWRVPHRAAVLALDAGLPDTLDALVAAALAHRLERVVPTWPFPPAGPPLPVDQVMPLLARLDGLLADAGVPWSLKGLPACHAGEFAARVARSRNRFYVDADHQLDGALLFVPDVVRFHKEEACRFCVRDGVCDGVARAWWERGLVGPLRPLDGLSRSG